MDTSPIHTALSRQGNKKNKTKQQHTGWSGLVQCEQTKVGYRRALDAAIMGKLCVMGLQFTNFVFSMIQFHSFIVLKVNEFSLNHPIITYKKHVFHRRDF